MKEIDEMTVEELKYVATDLFSDASSVRNKEREKFLKEFIKNYRNLKNSKSDYR